MDEAEIRAHEVTHLSGSGVKIPLEFFVKDAFLCAALLFGASPAVGYNPTFKPFSTNTRTQRLFGSMTPQ
jgi:hypothetical protein